MSCGSPRLGSSSRDAAGLQAGIDAGGSGSPREAAIRGDLREVAGARAGRSTSRSEQTRSSRGRERAAPLRRRFWYFVRSPRLVETCSGAPPRRRRAREVARRRNLPYYGSGSGYAKRQVRRQCELHELVAAEVAREHVCERGPEVAHEVPEAPREQRPVQHPPELLVLLADREVDRGTRSRHLAEVAADATASRGEPLHRRVDPGLEPGRHREGLAESRAAQLIEVAHLDEAHGVEQPDGAERALLRVALVEAVELVERRLDRQVAAPEGADRAAEVLVRSRTRTRRPRRPTAAAVRPPRPEPTTTASKRRSAAATVPPPRRRGARRGRPPGPGRGASPRPRQGGTSPSRDGPSPACAARRPRRR